MKGTCVDCVRFVVLAMVSFMTPVANSYGQFIAGGQGVANLPPNVFPAVPGQVQLGPIFGGQGNQAQIPQIPPVGIPGQFPQNMYPALGSMGTGVGNGSTPFSSGMNGQSTIVTGLGALELGTAQGNVLNQQATNIYLNNYKQAVSTYYDVRRIHDNARTEHQRVPATRDQLESVARVGVPHRLTKDEFDSATGKILWPEILAGPSFAEHRAKLEQLFRERSILSGGRGTDNYHAIRTVTGQMQSRLQSMTSSLSPQEYLTGHKFISGLAYEAARIPHPGIALAK